MNIARQHRERVLARKAAEAGMPSPSAAAAERGDEGAPQSPALNQAQMMLVKLTADRAALKAIQSREAKVAMKRTLLPDYQAWLDGLIERADALPLGVANDVLTTTMMWHIDTGDIARALDLAEIVLARKIPLPPHWNRTPGCAIAEQIAESAFDAMRAGVPFDHDWISRAQLITEAEDMPDEARAKLYKAEAQLLERKIDAAFENSPTPDGVAGAVMSLIDIALGSAEYALKLHPACGVKKLIDKLKRQRGRVG